MSDGNKEIKRLRRVGIETQNITAVSEFMNTTAMGLEMIDDTKQEIAASPVMMKMKELPPIPADAPTEDEVINGHEEVGLKLAPGSKKHPKRVSRAAEKRAVSREMISKREDFDKKPALQLPDTKDEKKKSYERIAAFDLGKVFFQEKGKSAYDILYKHYDEIKEELRRIPEYELVIREKLDNLNAGAPDDALIEAQANLKALYDINAYYAVFERIMQNKYYALLPHDEMHSLSFNELRKRLAKLYDADSNDRNEELIDYYQNLIRLKEIGLSDMKSVNERKEEYKSIFKHEKPEEEKRDPGKTIKEIAGTYAEILDHYANDKTLVTGDSVKVYKQRFFDTFKKEIDDFAALADKKDKNVLKLLNEYAVYVNGDFKDKTDALHDLILKEKPKDEDTIVRKKQDADKFSFTDAQKEGMRRVQAYLIKRGVKKKEFSFVNNLLEAPEEQQMLVFYLVENGKEESASISEYYSALYNYQPDYKKIEGKTLQTFSKAMRSAMITAPVLDKLIELEKNVHKAAKTVKDNDKLDNGKEDEVSRKKEGLVTAIKERGAMLHFLYRNAGMHEDMPPDMAADPMLRQRLFSEYREIGKLINDLVEISTKSPLEKKENKKYVIEKLDYEQHEIDRETAENPDDDSSEFFDKASNYYGKFNEWVIGDGLGYVSGGLSAAGDYVKPVTSTSTFGFISSGVGGLTALFGAVGVALTVAGLVKDNTLSTPDAVAQWIDVTGDTINIIGGTVTSIATLGSAIANIGEAAAEGGKWLGDTADALWATGSVGDVVTMVGGGICVVAGTVKMVSSGIQAGRLISTGVDIHRAKKTLKTKDQNNLTRDERLVKQFLDHQTNEAIRKGVSSGVGMITGTMGIIAGGLAMTGYLAPIGALVGVGALTLEIANKVTQYFIKRKQKKIMVDDFLNLDQAVENVLNSHPEKEKLKKYGDSLKDLVREELLSSMGFSSWKTCYKYICTQMAMTMYKKVFLTNPQPEDRDMYLNAMKSLGLKIKEPNVQGDEPKPTIDAMVSKMMA